MRLAGEYVLTVEMRSVIGPLLASTTLLCGAAGCSAKREQLTCVVKLGGAQTTVPLDTQFGGDAAVATVGDYTVTYSILDNSRKYAAEVKHGSSVLMTMTASGDPTVAGGSSTTPDGQLEFFCRP